MDAPVIGPYNFQVRHSRLIISSVIRQQGDTDEPVGKPTPMPLFLTIAQYMNGPVIKTESPGYQALIWRTQCQWCEDLRSSGKLRVVDWYLPTFRQDQSVSL